MLVICVPWDDAVVNYRMIDGGDEVAWLSGSREAGRTQHGSYKYLVSRPGGLILHDMWMQPQGKDRLPSIQRSGRPSPGQIEPHRRTGRERATDRGPELWEATSAEVPPPASFGGTQMGPNGTGRATHDEVVVAVCTSKSLGATRPRSLRGGGRR
jgi:hypothetical protein